MKILLEEFTRSGIRELHVRKADFEIYLSTEPGSSARSLIQTVPAAASANASAPVAKVAPPSPPVTQAPAAASASALPENAIIVTAPNLGTFYRAPKPGAANYVEVGSTVSAGDELCLIEVMKLFTALRAETAGRVHAVLVEDGAMVEGGQPLFALVSE
ncbi:acetyl-CoA carboxylase biotin carboxyl carrier protein [Novosphingobium sp. Rr 2-17]|uniref:acetyl-CoA carboxylase biotin carboxyl carrier protein n=1 Tax=Novosphingobium sp. Rr 2-17 TaxID=555793 RepID=UPI001ED94E5B|nr:acetyl-CoA carboxylase biotin carboxyl carrier protein [Novosphingobium sp. Rr 2-17]